MKVAVIKNIIEREDVYIERSLPNDGIIFVKKGDRVSPLDNLGSAEVSYASVAISFTGSLKVSVGDSVAENDVLSYGMKRLKREKVLSPIHGEVYRIDNKEKKIYIRSFPQEYELISGFEGVVENIAEGRSVLLKSRATSVPGVLSSGFGVSGELVVFEDISGEDNRKYFEGKIVLFSRNFSEDVYKKLVKFGTSGVVVGGMDSCILEEAKNEKFPALLLYGYGKIPVISKVVEYLRSIQGRFVILRGETKELLIPKIGKKGTGNEKRDEGTSYLEGKDRKLHSLESSQLIGFREPVAGDLVQVFIRPFFGWEGEIIKIYDKMIKFESKIYAHAVRVRLRKNKEEIDVALRNIRILE